MVDGELDLQKEPLDDNSGDESSIADVESMYWINLYFIISACHDFKLKLIWYFRFSGETNAYYIEKQGCYKKWIGKNGRTAV